MNDKFSVVQLVYMDETGDSYYRMRWPGNILSKQEPNWRVINLDARSKDKIKLSLEADLLVLFQSNDLDMHSVIRERRENGLKTLVEYNDDFYSPTAASPIRKEWSSPLLWQTYESIMNEADNIIVTGHGLKNLFTKKTDIEISILKNQVLKKYQIKSNKRSDNEFRIGWAGSLGHMGDLLAVLPKITEFCLENKNAFLYIMGNESIPNYINLPPNKFVFKNWGTMEDYYSFLSSLDVGIAPLSSIPYNFSRSDIKAVEYASRGAVPVVQNILPYEEIIKEGCALGFSNFSELINILSKLYNLRSELDSAKENAFNYVVKNRSAEEITDRLELYKKYLPSSPRNCLTDSFNAGYHEIIGEISTEMKSSEILNTLIKLSETDLVQAEKFIEENYGRTEYDNNFCLTAVKIFFKSKNTKAEELLKFGISKFAQDLRFYLLFSQTRVSNLDKLSTWNHILEVFKNRSESYLKFYKDSVCQILLKDLESIPNLIPISFEIAKLCDDKKLFLAVGNYGLTNGDFHLAHEAYTRLSDCLKNAEEHIRELIIPENVLDTFIEASDFGRRMI